MSDRSKIARSLLSLDWLYDPKTRGLILQVALVLALVILGYEIVTNTAENLRKQNLASGFGFLSKTASFDISQTLIEYRSTESYGRAFLVGLLNTLLVSGLGIVLATLLGFAIGLGRLSHNWIIARLSTAYVELVRNVADIFVGRQTNPIARGVETARLHELRRGHAIAIDQDRRPEREAFADAVGFIGDDADNAEIGVAQSDMIPDFD